MRKVIIRCSFAASLLFLAADATIACEGDALAKFVNIAVDRCMARNVTLSFDMGKRGDRAFVTVSHEDGRKMYEALKAVYEVKR